jgi:Peptidase family M23
MPLTIGDSANVAFGLAPFGYHGADHAVDGHAGWDIEFRAGGLVRAAADGTVLSVTADPVFGGRTTVQVEHAAGQHFYRTIYTNLSSLSAEFAAGDAVTQGQVLGVAGSVTAVVGSAAVTYAMTHFQIDDFDFYAGSIPNPNAVSPELLLNAEGRVVFDRIWPLAVFAAELTEPFATNPRATTFPLTRTWMLESGDGPAGISFTRRDVHAAGEYEFAILAESGTALEAGAVTLGYTSRPLQTIALVAPTSVRLGVYDVVDDRLRLALAVPGAPRPADLTGAAIYRTSRPR